MKTRVWLPLATAVQAVMAPAFSRAQEGSPAGQAVVLAFKHKPGQARRLRFDMKADFTITNEGGGGLGALPIGLKSTAFFTEKVTSVEGPVASLLVTPHSMTMDTSVLGMSRRDVDFALSRLQELGLVAHRPWRTGHADGVWQLLPLPRSERGPRPSGEPVSIRSVLESLGLSA